MMENFVSVSRLRDGPLDARCGAETNKAKVLPARVPHRSCMVRSLNTECTQYVPMYV